MTTPADQSHPRSPDAEHTDQGQDHVNVTGISDGTQRRAQSEESATQADLQTLEGRKIS